MNSLRRRRGTFIFASLRKEGIPNSNVLMMVFHDSSSPLLPLKIIQTCHVCVCIRVRVSAEITLPWHRPSPTREPRVAPPGNRAKDEGGVMEFAQKSN